MSLKIVILAVFACAAVDALNVGEIGDFFHGFTKNMMVFSRTLDAVYPRVSCPESMDFYSDYMDETNQTALITITIDPSKCSNLQAGDSTEFCTIRFLPGLSYDSQFISVDCEKVNARRI